MVYTQMFFALGFDKLVFGTTPGFLSIIGSSLILGSALYVAVHKESAKAKEAPASVGNEDEERGLVSSMGGDEGDEAMAEVQTPVQEIPLRTLRV